MMYSYNLWECIGENDFSIVLNGITLFDKEKASLYLSRYYGDRIYLSNLENPTKSEIQDDFYKQWELFKMVRFKNYGLISATLSMDYNPIENCNRTETTTITNSGTDKVTNSGTHSVEYGKATTNSGSDNDTTTSSASGYNSPETMNETEKVVSTTTNGKKVTDSGTDTTIESNTDTTEYGKKEVNETVIHGSIGTITNQDMVSKEIKLRQYNLVHDIFKTFCNEISVYY